MAPHRETRGLIGAIILFSNILFVCSNFIEDPKLQMIRAENGDTVQFRWQIDEENFNPYVPFRFLFHRYDQLDEQGMKQTIFQYDQGGNSASKMQSNYENRIQVLKNVPNYVGFNLSDVQSMDAGNYICLYTTYGQAPESSKTLFIWGNLMGPPTVSLVPGERPSLLCNAESSSVPEEDRTGLVYSWQTTDGRLLNALPTDTIPVDEALGNSGASQGHVNIVCMAKEAESPKQQEKSNIVKLTRPELRHVGQDVIVSQAGRRDTAILEWWYYPGSLEGARISFHLRFTKAGSNEIAVVYIKYSTDPAGTISSEFRGKFNGMEGNSSYLGVSVKDVSLEEAGFYTVIATNIMTLDLRHQITIAVQNSPTKPELKLVEERPLKNGSNAILACLATSGTLPESQRQPLQYRWLKGSKILKSDTKHYSMESNKLFINRMEDSDYGTPFVCDALEETTSPSMRSEQSDPLFFNVTAKEEQIKGTDKQVDGIEEPGVQLYIGIGVGVGVLLVTLVVVVVTKMVRSKRRQYNPPPKQSFSNPHELLANNHANPPGDETDYINRDQTLPPPQPMQTLPRTPALPPDLSRTPVAPPDIYLHTLEKSPINLMVGEVIHPGPCYTLRRGNVIGEPEDKVAFKRMTADHWVDGKKFEDARTILMSQINALKQCSFDKVIKLMGCVTMTDPLTCIIELAPLGSLQHNLCQSRKPRKSMGEDFHYSPMSYLELLVYARDVASGMQYLHSLQVGILHPYLCTNHVLVFPGPSCKVTGFMLAQDIKIKHRFNIATKDTRPRRWMAPETLYNFEHTSKSDVWSFGVLLWEMFTYGKTPYPNLMDDALLPYIKSGKRMSKPETCKDDTFDAMNRCWMLTPENRPTFSEMLGQIQRIVDKETDTYASISFPRSVAVENETSGNEYMTPRDCRPLSMFAEETSSKHVH